MFHELMIFYCLKIFVFNLILAGEVSGSYEALKPQRSQILRVYSLMTERNVSSCNKRTMSKHFWHTTNSANRFVVLLGIFLPLNMNPHSIANSKNLLRPLTIISAINQRTIPSWKV